MPEDVQHQLVGEASPAEILTFNTLSKSLGPHAGTHDAYLLAQVCQFIGIRAAATERLRKYGTLMRGVDGTPAANPDVRVVTALSATINRALCALGLLTVQLDAVPDSAGGTVDAAADERTQAQMDQWQAEADRAMRLVRGDRT
jgi:hypothetical protein